MRVMIDPGHYGYYVNQSPIDRNYYESATVWKLGNYLVTSLRNRGVETELTRHDISENPPLVTRGEKSKGYDLFVSVHTNATGNSQGSDIANFPVCYTQVSGASTDIANRIGKALMPLFSASKWEAYSVKNAYGKDYYGVLQGATNVGTPGLIVEHGFHTCKANLQLLEQDSFLHQLAETDAQVIYEYLVEQEGGQVVVNPSADSLFGVVKGVPNGDVLNVRTGPGSNYEILKAYPALGNGNAIDVFGRDDKQGWLYIRIAGKYFGWVSRKYIEIK